MEKAEQNLVDSLVEAEKAYQRADASLRVVLAATNDPKILLKVLESLSMSLSKTISTILKIEYMYRRIPLSKETAQNLNIFLTRCAPRYGLSIAETATVQSTLALARKHLNSEMEFTKYGKVVILDNTEEVGQITQQSMQQARSVTRKLLDSALKNLKNTKR